MLNTLAIICWEYPFYSDLIAQIVVYLYDMVIPAMENDKRNASLCLTLSSWMAWWQW